MVCVIQRFIQFAEPLARRRGSFLRTGQATVIHYERSSKKHRRKRARDANYESIGTVYRNYRVADLRIAGFVHAALGNARTVLNIGVPSLGSCEPSDRVVTAVEPSATMRQKASCTPSGGS